MSYDRVHSTITNDAYTNLAIAIVANAMTEVIAWKLELLKPSRKRNYRKQMEADKAYRFLHDEGRISLFTDFTPQELDEMIALSALPHSGHVTAHLARLRHC